MRLLIQRVNHAQVTVGGQVIGRIGKGLLIFVGICESDNKQTAGRLIQKASNLRIFSDEDGKTNLSLRDVCGELLILSQFTLYANCKKGNRPSFTEAARPEAAKELYEYITTEFRKTCERVQTGLFGADMKVDLQNDGPFTLMLDSEIL